jgi:hypothetical protein
MSKVHPKTQSNILKTLQSLSSIKVNIIWSAVKNIEGITLLKYTTGGTGPELTVPNKKLLFP